MAYYPISSFFRPTSQSLSCKGIRPSLLIQPFRDTACCFISTEGGEGREGDLIGGRGRHKKYNRETETTRWHVQASLLPTFEIFEIGHR